MKIIEHVENNEVLYKWLIFELVGIDFEEKYKNAQIHIRTWALKDEKHLLSFEITGETLIIKKAYELK